jgi:hypothetical protein
MRRSLAPVIVAVLVSVTPALAQQVAHAQQFPAQLLGTWQLNLDKSTYDPGPAPVSPTTNITTIARVNGVVRMTVENVNSEGARNRTVTVISLDGKEQPVEGLQGVRRAFKLVDARTVEWTQRSESRPTSTTRLVLAPDGKTLTVTQSAHKNTLVFDKKK